MVSRPSETVTAAIGSIVGAALILVGAFTDVEVTTEVAGAITLLIAWIATGVTWWIARKQRAGSLGSAPDGTVTST